LGLGHQTFQPARGFRTAGNGADDQNIQFFGHGNISFPVK
jgi:hypothetical protein